MPALLRGNAPSDLQQAVQSLKGDSPSERWARARLSERQADLLAAAGLLGPAGEIATKSLKDCHAEAWEVTVRLHLLLARCLDALGADRRDAYEALRGGIADLEVEKADQVAKKLGDSFASRVLQQEVTSERAALIARQQPTADPARLFDPIISALAALRKSPGGPEGKNLAARALYLAQNNYADACRQRGNQLTEAGRYDKAVDLLRKAVGLFRDAAASYAETDNPVDVDKATLLQNQAVAMMNLGQALLASKGFEDEQVDFQKWRDIRKSVADEVKPADVDKLLEQALALARSGRLALGSAQTAPPTAYLHAVLLQNVAQAALFRFKVSLPFDAEDAQTKAALEKARRFANRSASRLENLGLYLDALNAMRWEGESLEISGELVEAVLVYLHGVELCERAVAGLAPADADRYRRIKNEMFGRSAQILDRLRQDKQPPPDDLLTEWGATWAELQHQVIDLSKARTFADFVLMGAVWRGSNIPLIKHCEDDRRDLIKLEERAATGELARDQQTRLAQLRQRRLDALTALVAGADRAYCETMALTRVSPAQVQSVMRDGEVLVSYFLWADFATVEVLAKTGPPKIVRLSLGPCRDEAAKLVTLPAPSDFETIARALVTLTQDGLWPERTGAASPDARPLLGKWPAALNLLYRLLVEPIAADLADAKTIFIVPHGALHYLPFEALITGFPEGAPPGESDLTLPANARFWGLEREGRQFAYLPTMGSLFDLRTRARRPAKGVGVVLQPRYFQHPAGDPYQAAVDGLRPLEDSLRAATGKPPQPVYQQERAIPDAAVSLLTSPLSLAVFGCHGKANWRAPLSSCLALAPSPGHEQDPAMADGEPLDLARTMTLPIRVPVVFLAACQTGQSADVAGAQSVGQMGRVGDDLLSLSRGYLLAGASALVTSVWECNPQVTCDFFNAFARAWLKGNCDVGAAVMAAKRQVLQRQAQSPDTPYATPTWWAGFEVHGDPACVYDAG
jgi:CHAT domain-containing protein/tetratricopeptide (TPR) repeat protein